MKRILILLITLGLLVGCSTINNNDSSIQESSKQEEIQDGYNISGKYFELGEDKIDLDVQPWYIQLPKNAIAKKANFYHFIHFENIQSKKVMERCGFTYEATIENGCEDYSGVKHDVVCHSIFKDDYFSN